MSLTGSEHVTPTVDDDLMMRFGFGANWQRFSSRLTAAQVLAARESLREALARESLDGLTFLDVGCGSGLFSLAAVELGAARVHSFDYDEDSVRCTDLLRSRADAADSCWTVAHGDALDARYMASLGEFDVVYAWGSLHHTGDMWAALALTVARVDEGGTLVLSLYNDQGTWSEIWRVLKRTYNRLPRIVRPAYVGALMLPWELRAFLGHSARLRPQDYVLKWKRGNRARGMSRWHDMVDWVGGYPFEVARPEQVLDFCQDRGLRLVGLRTCGGGWGCNQYVLRAESTRRDASS